MNKRQEINFISCWVAISRGSVFQAACSSTDLTALKPVNQDPKTVRQAQASEPKPAPVTESRDLHHFLENPTGFTFPAKCFYSVASIHFP
ncbi:hypothetical protein I7E32_14540 [Alcaligenes faecalis]|uniref:hypothetical protein n=1 Tax=Alcaligenes faecalis TaxID=511 RepID=UPI0018D00BAE|nr:hypothetical protein [Alcaligenes faecalis]MBH0311585.1 hypothetical protein [Alcaligenes faecalis]